MSSQYTLLQQLSDAFGPPNDETDVKTILRHELSEFADQTTEDALGNLFMSLDGDEKYPRVMLAAHMDEVAFLVTHIEVTGFLRFHTLGGITPHVMPGQRIRLRGTQGPVSAIIGTKPPHVMSDEDRKKLVSLDNLFMDIGANSESEVKSKGIDIGTVGVFDVKFQDLGNGYLLGKAFDDRVGCAVMVQVVKKLHKLNRQVVAVGTVQEEVGLRGARVAAWQVDPQYGLALEGSFTADVPGSLPHQISAKLQSGPVIAIADRTTLTHPTILNTLIQVGKQHKIPFQFKKIPRGGTDAGAIHLTKAGIPSGTVAVPCRYIHGPASILHITDYENTIQLVTQFVKALPS
ncbi:MAG: M42 family metallopeptidase [Candidatus Bathyarchaeota archaeon]|nr:M42 family metallopeptidase [Candidatus Bathyarchaeota archaeon]